MPPVQQMEAELLVSYCMVALTMPLNIPSQYLENGVFPAASTQPPRGLFPALGTGTSSDTILVAT